MSFRRRRGFLSFRLLSVTAVAQLVRLEKLMSSLHWFYRALADIEENSQILNAILRCEKKVKNAKCDWLGLAFLTNFRKTES